MTSPLQMFSQGLSTLLKDSFPLLLLISFIRVTKSRLESKYYCVLSHLYTVHCFMQFFTNFRLLMEGLFYFPLYSDHIDQI